MYSFLTLEDRKKVSIDILVHFIDYCEKHNLTYCLAYGTLIGAIRHQGFIPWDDDIDVFMPREDYERFLKEYTPTLEFDVVSCWNNRTYHLPYAKVISKNTGELFENDIISTVGIGIDLFPLENLSVDDGRTSKVVDDCVNLYRNIIVQCMYYRQKPQKGIKNNLQHCLGDFLYKSGLLNCVARKIDNICKNNQVVNSEYVGSVLGIERVQDLQVYKKTAFESEKKIFENLYCVVPRGYDTILTSYYGDYMKLPPVEKQQSTHSNSFIWLNSK